jgi:DNA-binding NarL/FixJ family response regulator
VTDVTQVEREVRAPSVPYRPANGRGVEMRPRMDVLEPGDVMVVAETGAMIRTLSRFTVAQQDAAPVPRADPAEPDRADQSANADHGTGAEPGVTAEELTILTLMANGLTLDSVAVRVSMSPRTLSRRLRCVCDRLGVTYPIQAIVWAARQGLI